MFTPLPPTQTHTHTLSTRCRWGFECVYKLMEYLLCGKKKNQSECEMYVFNVFISSQIKGKNPLRSRLEL